MLKTIFRWLLAIFFVIAGTLHFRDPQAYLPMMPGYLPWHLQLIYLSGAAEVLGGLGVLLPPTRRLAGWGLVVLLVAVFPANVQMLMQHTPVAGMHPPEWVLWARLPFQAVFIVWTLWATKPDAPQPDDGLVLAE